MLGLLCTFRRPVFPPFWVRAEKPVQTSKPRPSTSRPTFWDSEARSAANASVFGTARQLEQPKLEEALKETPMFPLTRIQFLKFAAAGAFVVLSVASTPASADEMFQNLGPVGPNEAVLATIGSMHVIAFFEPTSGRCALNAVVWDNLGADAGKSAKRVRVSIEPGQIAHIDTAEQQSVHLQCGSNAATLAIIDIDSLVASGVTAQPPGQPVKPGF
jgi:hypothetical protein